MSSRAAGTSRDSRAARLAEIVAATAATEMMVPDVAAIVSMPGRCATWSGIRSASPRSTNCATKSSASTTRKCG